jgi:transposase
VNWNRTSVGLDVHARSVVACGVDGWTGVVFERQLCPEHGEIIAWLHLARLLHLGEIVAVTVPSVAQEAARDLVRSREDTRGDLMAARHRLSKLLLRQGIVYYGGTPWTGVHEQWLRVQRRSEVFTTPGLGLAFDVAYDTLLATTARRDRLNDAIAAMAADSEFTPVVTRLGCLRGVSTLTGFGLAAEIGDWRRLSGRSIGAYLGLVPAESSSGQSRSQGAITKTGNGHARRLLTRPPGTTANHTGPQPRYGAARTGRARPPAIAASGPISACTAGGRRSTPGPHRPWSPTPRSPANWPAGAGLWPCSTTDHPDPPGKRGGPRCPDDVQVVVAAPASDPRRHYEQPPPDPSPGSGEGGTRSMPDRGPTRADTPSSGNQPAHIRLTTRRKPTRSPPTEASGNRGGVHDDGRGHRLILPT